MDPIKVFYESIDVAQIESWLESKETEGFTLEFKRVPDEKNLKKSQEHFSKVVTAFGNAGGGVIVWGVYCGDPREYEKSAKPSDNEKTSRDHVLELPGLKNPGAFIENMLSWESRFIDPPFGGLEHRAVGKFVATYVPSHPRKPFQSSAGRGTYYMRSGSDCVPMSHGVVQSMILGKSRPIIKVHLITKYINGLGVSKNKTGYRFEIRNLGPKSLENWRIQINADSSLSVALQPEYPFRLGVHHDENSLRHRYHITDLGSKGFAPGDKVGVLFFPHGDEAMWDVHRAIWIKVTGTDFFQVHPILIHQYTNGLLKNMSDATLLIPAFEPEGELDFLETEELPHFDTFKHVWHDRGNFVGQYVNGDKYLQR
ncbi:MAG: ATP-binding protein [Fimbriimonadaceae bacterium]|nr:ATP-binding protein [Fimbriimonadaceae bacterium]